MLVHLMSHVEFKKCPCRVVDFSGLGPFTWYSILIDRCGRETTINYQPEVRGGDYLGVGSIPVAILPLVKI